MESTSPLHAEAARVMAAAAAAAPGAGSGAAAMPGPPPPVGGGAARDSLGATNDHHPYAPERAFRGEGDVLSVAPMMEWTNRHYRYMARLLTRRTRLYTEMIVDSTLLHSPWARALLRFHPDERPVACQVGGSDPASLARAAAMIEEAGYDEINLNCGCPSPRVAGKGSFGASLMFSPEGVRDAVTAMAAAAPRTPVTVKCRLGVDALDSYEAFRSFVRTVSSTGACTHFVVHARKALLKGLDPKGNRTVPPLRYAWVQRVALEHPHLRISLNGGVVNFEQAEALLSLRRAGPELVFSAEALAADAAFFAAEAARGNRRKARRDAASSSASAAASSSSSSAAANGGEGEGCGGGEGGVDGAGDGEACCAAASTSSAAAAPVSPGEGSADSAAPALGVTTAVREVSGGMSFTAAAKAEEEAEEASRRSFLVAAGRTSPPPTHPPVGAASAKEGASSGEGGEGGEGGIAPGSLSGVLFPGLMQRSTRRMTAEELASESPEAARERSMEKWKWDRACKALKDAAETRLPPHQFFTAATATTGAESSPAPPAEGREQEKSGAGAGGGGGSRAGPVEPGTYAGPHSVVDSIMIGRAAYGNSWMLADADRRLFGQPNPGLSRREVVAAYLDYVVALPATLGPGELEKVSLYRPFELVKPLFGLFAGEPGSSKFRMTVAKGIQEEGMNVPNAVRAALELIPDYVLDERPPG